MTALFYISLLPLLAIFVQDLRSRAIWWFLPPLAFSCFVAMRWQVLTPSALLVNGAFVLALIGFVMLYVRIRFGGTGNPLSTYFGLGDVLYLLAITPLFPFPGFVYFFTFGTVAVLVLHGAVSLFKKSPNIPYAGYFALITGVVLLVGQLDPESLLILTACDGEPR